MSYPFVLQNAITNDFCKYITEYTNTHIDHFYPNGMGPNRKFLYFKDPVVDQEKPNLLNKFNLIDRDNYIPKLAYADLIAIDTENGFVHPHVDFTEPGYVHVRINTMISKPIKGGNPILDSNQIHVEQCDAWLCISSVQNHKTDPVVGNVPRIILSMGFLIRDEDFAAHLAQYNLWKSSLPTSA